MLCDLLLTYIFRRTSIRHISRLDTFAPCSYCQLFSLCSQLLSTHGRETPNLHPHLIRRTHLIFCPIISTQSFPYHPLPNLASRVVLSQNLALPPCSYKIGIPSNPLPNLLFSGERTGNVDGCSSLGWDGRDDDRLHLVPGRPSSPLPLRGGRVA